MSTTSYGWIITLSALPSPNSGKWRFGINLIRPAVFPDAGDPRGPEYKEARNELGDLFFPWAWEEVSWHVFGKNASGWKSIDRRLVTCESTGASSVCPLSDDLRDGIKNEITEATKECKYPFSQDIRDYWGKNHSRSLVHSLAPLTHWPAVASGSVLKLTWVFEVEEKHLNGLKTLACFPQFKFAVGTRISTTGDPQTPVEDTKYGLQVASYSPSDPSDPSITMACEAVQVINGSVQSGADPKLKLGQGGLSRSALHGLVLSHLLPLRVLAEWIRKLVDLDIDPFKGDTGARRSLRDALWKSLGIGEEYAPACRNGSDDISEHAPFIVELLIPDELADDPSDPKRDIALTFREALKDHSVKDGNNSFNDVIGSLAKAQVTVDRFTPARRAQWQIAAQAWERLTKETTKNGGDSWRLDDWLLLADLLLSEEGACEFFGPWLATVLADKLSTIPPWDQVEAELRRPGSIRLDMWQRVMAGHVTKEQWQTIPSAAGLTDATTSAVATLFAIADERYIERLKEERKFCVKVLCDIRGKIRSLPPEQSEGVGPERIALNAEASRVRNLSASLRQATPDRNISQIVNQFRVGLASQSSCSRIRPKDRGIELHLEAQSCGTDTDENIRGYAVALCGAIRSGGKWFRDERRAQWITDTALWHTPQKKWLANSKGEVLWMHDTIGATEANGERVAGVEYLGLPLSSTIAKETGVTYAPDPDGEDTDGFKCVDFAWPWSDTDYATTSGGRDLPLLAYGAYYRAVAVPIGNAGVPLSTEYIDKAVPNAPYELKAAKDLDDFSGDWSAEQDFRYLSSRRPAAPKVVKDIDEHLYELDEDTQAHAFQHWLDTKPNALAAPSRRVALIAGSEARNWLRADLVQPGASAGFTLEECSFTITTPTTDADFCRRWLAMDRLVKTLRKSEEATDYSDSTFASSSVSQEAMLQFERMLCGDRFAEHRNAVRDLSVSAIGVEVWNPCQADKPTDQNPRRLRPFVLDGVKLNGKELQLASDELTVKVSAIDTSTWSASPNGKTVSIQVPPGEFVRIRAYSLVRESHFKSGAEQQRFADGIADKDAPVFPGGYRAFGVLELWVEAMPSWDAKKVDTTKIELSAHAPGTDGNGEDTVSAHADFSGVDDAVRWIRDLYLQRHEWHWTGYPVRFPGADLHSSVEAWLPSLAGVESYRASQTIRLGSSFSGSKANGYVWQLGLDNRETFFSRDLTKGPRPARFEGYFVKLVPRFRKWLKADSSGPLGLESHTLAATTMLPGRGIVAPDARLPPPVLRWAVPLTTTHDVAPVQNTITRTSNGVMLVFDEALHRTDDLADVGGLGEVIEVDLVDTRDPAHPEIGVNPIFHPLKPVQPDSAVTADEGAIQEKKVKGTLGLVAGRPFGLTHDIGPNPKVAQTAIVVRPEHAGGRWIMAKVRTRRLILPETEFGVSLSHESGDTAWPTRKSGEDVVPLDVAIDVNLETNPVIKLLIGSASAPSPTPFDLSPAKWEDKTERLLLTWHKGRWGEGQEVFWCCQLLQQKREDADGLTWRTLTKTSCHEIATRLGEFRKGTFIGEKLKLKVENAPAERISVLRCSDYTEPMWLTFIGSFGRDSIGEPQDYRAKIENETLVLTSLRSDAPLPVFRHVSEVKDSSTSGRDASNFHIALVYRQVPDVLKGRSGMAGGVLERAFIAPEGVSEGQREVRFKQLKIADVGLGKAARQAYVFAVQADSGLCSFKADTFDELLNQLFPDPDRAESRLRILPEYLGPIDFE